MDAGIIIFGLFVIILALASRTVIVNNHLAPSASATASALPTGPAPIKNLLGWLIFLSIAAVIIIVSIIALRSVPASVQSTAPIAQPAIIPTLQIIVIAPTPEVKAITPAGGLDSNVMIAVLLLVVSISALVYFRHHPPKPIAPRSIESRPTETPIPISADRPLQEVMDKNQP